MSLLSRRLPCHIRWFSTAPKLEHQAHNGQEQARPSQYFEFGQNLAGSPIRELPFSTAKKNSYVDVFKRHRFDLSMEHKNTFLLSQFLSPTGRLLPANMTQLSARSHKAIAKSIRRARCMGLMPYLCRRPFLSGAATKDDPGSS